MSGIQAVIFDFDGVIVESLDVKTEAFRALFGDHPEHQEQIVQLHLNNLGVSRYDKFTTIYRELLGYPLDAAEMARLDRRFSELVFERVVACSFVTGAPELLRRLAPDHALFVASATPEDELKRIVSARGVSALFTGIRGSPDSKDEIIAKILHEQAIAPEDAAMVGDAISDYRAAAANGVPFIGRVADAAANPFAQPKVPTVRHLRELDERWDEITESLVVRSG